jgi:hypothetical protein
MATSGVLLTLSFLLVNQVVVGAAAGARGRPSLFSLRRIASIPLAAHHPQSASAASATYDFGYRLERSLDPAKRGPATAFIDGTSAEDTDDGASLLDAMCSPVLPPPSLPTEGAELLAAPPDGASAAAAAASSAKLGAVGAAAAAAGSSAEPVADVGPLQFLLDNFALEAAWISLIALALAKVASEGTAYDQNRRGRN